jgi:hypothetical protein
MRGLYLPLAQFCKEKNKRWLRFRSGYNFFEIGPGSNIDALMGYTNEPMSIYQAILDNNLEVVHRLLRDEPSAVSLPYQSWKSPLHLALALENYPICMALLRRAPHDFDEINLSPTDLLERVISDFSETMLYAAWYSNIEFVLWALVTRDTRYLLPLGQCLQADTSALDDIKWLSEWCDGWIYWSDDSNETAFIAVDKWLLIYESYVSVSLVETPLQSPSGVLPIT